MADLKTTQLTEDIEPTYDDLIMTVNSPGGSPGNKKVQFANASKAMGWVDVRSYASINAAVTAIGATQTILVVPNAQTLTASVTLTIPSTLSLVILNGGSIVKASGSTLVINGLFEGCDGCFVGFSAGDVTFGAGSVKEVYAEWWGIDGTADEVQINMALAAFYRVRLLSKTYILAATISEIRHGSILEGSGRIATTLSPNAQTFPAITITGTSIHWRVSDFRIIYLAAVRASNPDAIGIKIAGFAYMFSIRDVAIYYCYNGIYSSDLSFMFDLTNIYVSECGDYGIYMPNPTVATTITLNNIWVNGGAGGFKITNVAGLVMNNCATDNIDKGMTINIFTSCIVTLNYFAVEGCTVGGAASLLQFSGSSTVLNGYKGTSNTYDESAGQESYGIRADGGVLIVSNPVTYGEIHTGAGTSFALIGSGTGHILVLGGSVDAPTGGSTYGIYTANHLTTVFDGQSWKFYGSISNPKIVIFTDSDITPSVVNANIFKTTNSGATVITTFHDGIAGQEILIIFGDAVTTIAETDNIKLSAAFTSTADDTMKLIYDGTNWYEISRSVN